MKDPADPDAGPDGPPPDGPLPDSPPSCVPQVLLTGGTDPVAQGWTQSSGQPFTLTYGADYTRLETTTTTGARTSGQLLFSYPDVIEAGKPFAIEFELMVESVSAHNQLDSSAALLASFTPTVGNQTDRSQMIYLEAARLGFADDTQSFAKNLTDGAYHVFKLARDDAGTFTVTVDGAAALSRANYTSNGRIAIGDQTNDANVDGVMRVRKITKLCL